MKNFILSFILPRRMEEHRDMNLFIAVLLFALSMIICAGVPSSRMEKMIKNNYLSDCYVFEGTYESSFNKVVLPSFTVKDGLVDNYQLVNNQKVYEIPYNAEDGSVINLTIVYQFDVDNDNGVNYDDFSIDEYLKVNPFDAEHNLKQKDILVVYTKTAMYYIFNRGYNLGYTEDKEGKLEDYSYLNVQTWRDTGYWSFYEHDLTENTSGEHILTSYYYLPNKDDANQLADVTTKSWSVRTTNPDATVAVDGKTYNAVQRINNNMYELFSYNDNTNVGMYTYTSLEQLGVDYLNIEDNPLTNYADLLVMDLSTSVRTYSYILSFFYVMILPIIWVLVVWLIMHKNGELVRFREYYSIASIAFLIPSIIIGIVGLFIPYSIIARFAMILHAGYYFVVITRINSMTKDMVKTKKKTIIETTLNNQADDDVIATKPITEVETKITDYENKVEEKRPKASEVE